MDHTFDNVRGRGNATGLEAFSGFLARILVGTYFCVASRHLHAYAYEPCLRFNERRDSHVWRSKIVVRNVGGQLIQHRKLTARKETSSSARGIHRSVPSTHARHNAPSGFGARTRMFVIRTDAKEAPEAYTEGLKPRSMNGASESLAVLQYGWHSPQFDTSPVPPSHFFTLWS